MTEDTNVRERYELRLVRVVNEREDVIETRDVPADRLEARPAELPDRAALSLLNAHVFAPITLAVAIAAIAAEPVTLEGEAGTGAA